MKEKWLQLDKDGHVRLIFLLLICIWCAYCVIAYSHEIYSGNLGHAVVDTKNMGKIWIDGSDFTGIFSLLGGGANLLVAVVVLGGYSIATIVMTWIPLFLFWLIGIRKLTAVKAEEAELAMNICGLLGAVSLLGGILITLFHSRLPAVWLTLCWLFPCFLFVILPFRKRIAVNGGQTPLP